MEKYMCRVCLADNVRMHPVTTDLQQTYEKLTNNSFVAEGKSLLACYICYARLQHSQRLMVTCLRAEEMLTKYINGTQRDRYNIRTELSSLSSLSATGVLRVCGEAEVKERAERADWGVGEDTMTLVKREELSNESDVYSDTSVNDLSQSDPEDDLPLLQTKDEESRLEYTESNISTESFHEYDVLEKKPFDTELSQSEPQDGMILFQPELITQLSNEPNVYSDTSVNDFSQSDFEDDLPLIQIKDKESRLENTGSDINTETPAKKTIDTNEGRTVSMRSSPNTGNKSYECHLCHKIIRRKNLTRHMKVHTGDKPFQCNVCKLSFGRVSNLNRHIQRFHDGSKGGPRQNDLCEICGKSYRHSSMKAHIRVHTGEKPFKCHICQSSFTVSQNLKDHMLLHTGDKPFKCDLCGDSFGRKSDLKYHLLVHTGKKSFKCHECGSSFYLKHGLKEHLIKHASDKSYKCYRCPATFKRKHSLSRHRLVHTGDQ